MNPPTLSVVLTINERPRDVLWNTFNSLRAEMHEQTIVVLDRSSEETKGPMRVIGGADDLIELEGPPGWLCPARAWNAGFEKVTSELTYVLSSETIQAPGNIEKARALLSKSPAVLFGKCVESEPGKYGFTRDDGVLCSSECARPLGFIACFPTWAMRAIGGYDEKFMDGYWYDDDDFFYRLWRLNLPFIFDDGISGVHQSHPRPVLDTPEGQAGIERNKAYIVKKWGSEHPIHAEKIHVWKQSGRTVWFRKPELVTEVMKEIWTV